MRIWIINPFDPIPGEAKLEGRYWSLALEFAKRGHSVIWWTSSFNHLSKTNRISPSIDGLPFSVRLVQVPPYKRNVSFMRLINHRLFARNFYKIACRGLKRQEIEVPDRMIISIPPLDVPEYALKIQEAYGVKTVIDLQDAWPEAFYRFIPGRGKTQKRLANIVFAGFRKQAVNAVKHASAITAVAKAYLDIYGVYKSNIPMHVTPIGIRLSDFDKNSELTQKPAFPICFVYVGSISSNYDLETVLNSAAVLNATGFDFRIRIAGMGPKQKQLIRNVNRKNLNNKVYFYGFLSFDRLARLLANCHVAINPIMPESFCALPNKIGDYLAASLPVINSVQGDLDEMLTNHNAGEFYFPRSVNSLAEAMLSYINNPAKATLQGKNARKLAESLFNRDKTYPEMVKFVEELQERPFVAPLNDNEMSKH